ncbi:hypothetical protein [Bacillus cereus]|uniref:hypothetical protein n=1 Tax=Bacillus cereus TaxID=1396 RepID=UPI000BF421C9|nr:hypothetical protein [Bacillus cereus]PER25443.1 hypothetical protein CN476_12900 [Bacillus cereus]
MPYAAEHNYNRGKKRLYIKRMAEISGGTYITRGNVVHLGNDKILIIDKLANISIYDLKTLIKTSSTGNITTQLTGIDFTRKRLIDLGELYFGVYYQGKIIVYAKSTQNKVKEILNVFLYEDFTVSHVDDNGIYILASSTDLYNDIVCCMQIDKTATIVNEFTITVDRSKDIYNSFISKDLEFLYVLEKYAIKIYSYKTKQLIKTVSEPNVKFMSRLGNDVLVIVDGSESDSHISVYTLKKGFSDYTNSFKNEWKFYNNTYLKKIHFVRKNYAAFIGSEACFDFYKSRNATPSANMFAIDINASTNPNSELTSLDNDRILYNYSETDGKLVFYKTVQI